MNDTNQFLTYSFSGQLVECTDRGFGYIRNHKGVKSFAHINGLVDAPSKTIKDLEGRFCIFALGGDAFRYRRNKPDWKESVVRWQVVDPESGITAESFGNLREQGLLALETGPWESLLKASWYFEQWKKGAKTSPKIRLNPDKRLGNKLLSALSNSSNLGEYLRLLEAAVTSPFYSASSKDYPAICDRFFKPDTVPLKVFRSKKSLVEYKCSPNVLPLIKERLQEIIAKSEVVSIDLESNGNDIFQYGWKNAESTGLSKGRPGVALSQHELHEAATKSVHSLSSPCLVGHNFIKWDWSILLKHNVEFPDEFRIWDTLIVSWMLEPWKQSHALVVEENAHQADADAEATYTLFEVQHAKLKPYLNGTVQGIQELVDLLLGNSDLLGAVEGRSYPNALKRDDKQFCLYPGSQRSELEWQEDCSINYLSPELKLHDPHLVPEICNDIAADKGGLYSKIIALVVADAYRCGVQVRLSMIPQWLISENDELRDALRERHIQKQDSQESLANSINYLTDDLFRLEPDKVSEWISSNKVCVFSPQSVLQEWNHYYCERLTDQQIDQRFPGVTDGTTGSALLNVNDRSGRNAWLIRESLGFNEEQGAWTLLPAKPDWLDFKNNNNSALSFPEACANWAVFPKWKDGNARKLDVDRLFVSSDTENRTLYMADILHCVLNLLLKGEEEFLIVAMRWEGEAIQLEKHLSSLSLTAKKSSSPLRQLEYVIDQNFRVVICSRAQLEKYIEAAESKGIIPRIVVDEVPLQSWYCALNRPDAIQENASNEGFAENQLEEDEDSEETVEDAQVREVSNNSLQMFRPKSEDILQGLSSFLVPWLHGLFPVGFEPDYPVLVLDARIYDGPSGKRRSFLWEERSFYSLEELLDDGQREIYYDICFPRRPEVDVPNTYEAYRAFLKEHWEYDDFREGPQQEAIHALVENRDDLLLRLPTGGGKSIVFHLPALLRSAYTGRLTVVITPLRALMADQVQGLWNKRFTESVDFLSGGRDSWLNQDAYRGILDGRVKLIFVAPERFRVSRFTEVLERRRRLDGGLEFIVFDETHCVSEWGFEFRPDYLYAAHYVAEWFKDKDLPGNPHRMLLTSATVTQRNRHDLEKELRLGVTGPYSDLPKEMPHPIQPFILLDSSDLPENEESPPDDPKIAKMVEIISAMDLAISAVIIFVRRRKDCHRISEFLNDLARQPDSAIAQAHALPFHAGLPEGVKVEACDLLQDRKANVLVCTKAFGMGMDIPHLHACIHHRPPTYIEDYLQEVGRIGRDKEERVRAGREQVEATLLYSRGDMERNIGMLQENAIRPPDLQVFMEYCISRAVHFPAVQKYVALIPAVLRVSGARKFDENQVTTCLFWLERAGVLVVEGRHPPFVDLSIKRGDLRNVAGDETLAARVASALLAIINDSISIVAEQSAPVSGTASRESAESSFSRFIRGLKRGFLALVSPEEEKPRTRQATANQNDDNTPMDMSVSMSELLGAVGGISMDELFLGLFELRRRKCLAIHKKFTVRRYGIQSSETYWDVLQFAVERLLRSTDGGVEHLPRKKYEKELEDWYRKKLTEDADDEESILSERQRSRDIRRSINTALRLSRYAGIEIKETSADDGTAMYSRSVGSQAIPAKRQYEAYLKELRGLTEFVGGEDVGSGEIFDIHLESIVQQLGDELRISRLQELMKLMETSGFYGLEGSMSEWVSIISINKLKPLPNQLPDHDPTIPPQDKVQDVYVEMLEKHRLQELRAQCMILLTVMPVENRKDFIDAYFEAQTGDEIEKLLEDTVGDVDVTIVEENEILQEILIHVRRERFGDEIQRLNAQQKAVCVAPYNQRLLVNAGPGSGKTHVLMMRCAHLIHQQGIQPGQILVLAFNRAVVFEIRRRIRDLFRALGYGSYVNRLDVATFHSFALRHQQELADRYQQDAIEDAVHQFAQQMQNADFAQGLSSQYQAVLVDEFQDMNEDFYSVVTALAEQCAGGVMVIGDDDQDILTWNRRDWIQKHHQKAPLVATEYYNRFEQEHEPSKYELLTNYRSVPQIVTRANGMIAKVADRIKFDRMKADVLLEANRDETGIEQNFTTWADGLELVQNAHNRREGVAVLCRSNRECRRAYEDLIHAGMGRDQINIMGGVDLALYQLRSYGALMQIAENRESYVFVDAHIWNQILDEYDALEHADRAQARQELNELYELVRKERGRPRVSDLVDFIRETRLSDIERLKSHHGMIGWQSTDGNSQNNAKASITVSTIHKVKGLEFETVVIMPSDEQFPMRAGDGVEAVDSAEEARLFYVAMTRACNNLYVGWGGRERRWYRLERLAGADGVVGGALEGSPEEVYVSWPGQTVPVNDGAQDHVKLRICNGDHITRNGKSLLHDGTCIARLSTKGVTKVAPGVVEFRVAHVMRYNCGEYMRQNSPNFWDRLHPDIQRQGWCYTILVENL